VDDLTADAVHAELPARWPAPVRAELERRHRRLTSLAQGRVLDLSTPAGRARLGAVLAGDQGDAGESLDAVVSVAGLVRFADLPAALAAVRSMLAPGGELLACEPTSRPGAAAMLVASAAVIVPASRGTHLERDVTAALRGAGLLCDTVERFDLPTRLPTLRPAVQVRAVRVREGSPA
jgi:hypothetical protein